MNQFTILNAIEIEEIGCNMQVKRQFPISYLLRMDADFAQIKIMVTRRRRTLEIKDKRV